MSYVLRVNSAEADAWVSKTLTDPEPEIWTTLVVDFPAASVAELVASGSGFMQLSVLIDAATRVGGVGIDGGGWVSTSDSDGVPAAGVTTIEVQHLTDATGNVYINGALAMTDTDGQVDDAQIVAVGLIDSLLVEPCTFDITSVRVGRTRGTADLFFDNFDSGDLSKWTDTFGNVVVVNPALEPTVEITYDGADTVTAVITNPAGSRYLLLVDSSTFTDTATASTSPLTLTATLSGLSPGDVFDAVVLPEEGNMGIGYTIFAYGTAAQVTSEAAFRRDGRTFTCDFVGDPGVDYELWVQDTSGSTTSAVVTGAGEATVTLDHDPTAAPGCMIHQYIFAWVQVVGDYQRGLLATRLFDPDLDGAGFRGNPLGGTITWTNLGLPVRLNFGIESTKVLKADAADDDAYVGLDYGDQTDVWVTFGLAFDADALALWQGGDVGYCLTVMPTGDESDGDRIIGYMPIDGTGWDSDYGAGTPLPDPTPSAWHLYEARVQGGGVFEIWVDGTQILDTACPPGNSQYLHLGQIFSTHDPASVAYMRFVKVGTTRGADDLFSDDFGDGTLDAWTSTSGAVSVVEDPFP